MKTRDAFLASTGAGILLGAVTWLVVQKATAPPPTKAADIGDAFPTITGKNLLQQDVTLPDDFAGRVGIFLIGDSYRARFDVEAWVDFLQQHYADNPELRFLEVALISGFAKYMHKSIDAAMVRGTTPEQQEHVLTIYGDLRGIKAKLGLKERPTASVYVIGRTGRIAWTSVGPPDAERTRALFDVLTLQGIESA